MANALCYGPHSTATSDENSSYNRPIPGYTGYLPRGEHLFGERFAVVRKLGKQKQDRDVQLFASKLNERQNSITSYINSVTSKRPLKTPLKPKVDKESMHCPTVEEDYSSPYTLHDDHPRRKIITGYRGFIPRAEEFMGAPYGEIARKAFRKFNVEMKTAIEESARPLDINRNIRKDNTPCTNVYHSDTGMMPQYSGHVQGARYLHGKSYATITKEAICEARAARKAK